MSRQQPTTFDEATAALRRYGANSEFLKLFATFRDAEHIDFEGALRITVENMCISISDDEIYAPTVDTLMRAGLTAQAAQRFWDTCLKFPPMQARSIVIWLYDFLIVAIFPPKRRPYPFVEGDTRTAPIRRDVGVGGKSLSLNLRLLGSSVLNKYDEYGLDENGNQIDLLQLLGLPPANPGFIYLFHGTTSTNAEQIIENGVNLAAHVKQDFNVGGAYYVTNNALQAWHWAFCKAANRARRAIVVHCVPTAELYAKPHVMFSAVNGTESGDVVTCVRHPAAHDKVVTSWIKFVRYCRRGMPPGRREYDVLQFVEGLFL